MSGIELKPCALSSGGNILVPLGTTTIGRGPFLSIADKRVSRNHAILEIENGLFRVKPIHVNPTFFAENGEAKLKPLKKDEWKKLENGNRVSLTPNEHIFEVVIDDRPVQASLTQSPRSSPVKALPKESPAKSAVTADETEDAPSPACRKLEFVAGENNGSTGGEETNGQIEDVKKQEDKDEGDKDQEESKPAVPDTKEYAKPVDRKRTLPAWMSNLPSSSDQTAASAPPTKTKATPKAAGRPKKRAADEIDDDDKETKPPAKKRAPPAPRNRKKKAPSPVSYKDDEDDESDEAPPPELKKRTSSRGRPTRSVSYAGDDDEDYDAAEDGYYDSDEGSDWENENSPKKKGKGGKGRSSTRGAKGRKRKGRPSYSDESSEEDLYIPKPTKRTSKLLSNSQRSSGEEELPPPRRRTNKKKKSEEAQESEEDDRERDACMYGAKCYRKNPTHLKEFSHPGNDDYNDPGDEEEVAEEDKPGCPYGAECYRKNADHRKQFKHSSSTPAERPKRQTGRGRKKAGDSDDDAPNTYDYEDSFLDDGEDEMPKGRQSDDSDWDPGAQEDSEDVSQLVREAKDYVKNKKMQKPV